MRRFAVLMAAVGAWVWLAGNAPAYAQGVPSSFEQLGALVRPGDTITVIDATGAKRVGRLGLLSSDTLTLTTPAGVRQLGEADVAEIHQRRGDSLLNGAIIGAVSVTAFYGIMGAIFADLDGLEVQAGPAIAGGFVYAGIGAAAGAGIDALITHRYVVYRRGASTRAIGVAPILSRGRHGALVSVRF